MSVLIALLPLPLVSIAFGEGGRAPALENLSRGLIGLTLSIVAMAAKLFRKGTLGAIERNPRVLAATSRLLQGGAGLLLLTVALNEVFLQD